MFRVPVIVVLVAATVGACGGGDDESTPRRPAGTVAPPPADGEALVRLADKYLKAIGSGNFRAACQTRTVAEREAFAKVAGSCPQAFAAVSRAPGADELKALARSRARADTIGLVDGEARIPLYEGEDDDVTGTLTARRESGRYRLFEGVKRPSGE